MKCHILFSGKNKKNIISLSSAENAQRVVKVKLFISVNSSHVPYCYGTTFFLSPRAISNYFPVPDSFLLCIKSFRSHFIQTTLFIPTLDTTTKYVIMAI